MKKSNDAVRISRHISEFLYDYAPNFLTSSAHTLKSYKDALTLYVLFLESTGVTPINLDKKHFEKGFIEEWIIWMVKTRNCSPDTCNVRLGSFRAFLEYLAGKDIGFLYLYHDAKMIKRQKSTKNKVQGLTRDAVTAIMNEPDIETKTGRRDFTLMMLLYGTAGRIGEILAIKVAHLKLDGPKPYVNLYGKGGKTRTAYLLPRVTSNIRGFLREFHGANPSQDDYLFYSRVGGVRGQLTGAAIDKRIKKYSASAHEKCNDVPISVHAHQFRHAKASHWLEDGLNVVQVSFLLGHENLETTMKYLDITTAEKANALATLEPEKEATAIKKWRSTDGTLSGFLGLSR